MFSKEEIALAKPVVEAIRKLSEEACDHCGACEGKDEPTKGEWEPEIGEFCIYRGEILLLIQRSETSVLLQSIPNSQVCDQIRLDCLKTRGVIPLLHWERIKQILEDMGYFVRVPNCSVDNKRLYRHEFYAEIWNLAKNNREYIVSQCASTAQEAVQKAVIELGKEEK